MQGSLYIQICRHADMPEHLGLSLGPKDRRLFLASSYTERQWKRREGLTHFQLLRGSSLKGSAEGWGQGRLGQKGLACEPVLITPRHHTSGCPLLSPVRLQQSSFAIASTAIQFNIPRIFAALVSPLTRVGGHIGWYFTEAGSL